MSDVPDDPLEATDLEADRRDAAGKPQPAAGSGAQGRGWLDRSADDADLGWTDSGERHDRRDDAWYLSERPPHHEG